MEFVKHGSLICYISIHKEKLDPKKHFLKYALDIAEGMKYLGEKKIVHRDLAARNVLVANEFHVKISDFGLAQFTDHNDYYIDNTCRELPFKWHAPESLALGKFSSQSDVWSYGVTLYEMFSFGKEPNIECEGCDRDPTTLLNELKKGTRLPYPPNCSIFVYSELMAPCWKYEAKERPSFAYIVNMLENSCGIVNQL
ncbi:hypothetical protein AAG570_013015 [Ranatra chinensis]|uniref:Protein kinase domain-containing protein n=1 Tax=Ranatra chinensis TaxID=642074 RepID=A0ABD0YFP6_9HEMI